MKKRIVILTTFFLNSLTVMSKENIILPETTGVQSRACPMAYIGTSTGVNNESGLIGINLDIPVVSTLSIGAGAGLSSWGTKIYGEIRYYLQPCQRGWAFGAGVSHNTGLMNFKTQMETVYSSKEDVILNLDAQSNAFITVYRFWNLGKANNRFYIAFGWSVPITTPSYEQTSGNLLSDNSKNVMKILEPGGLILSLGFSFGMH